DPALPRGRRARAAHRPPRDSAAGRVRADGPRPLPARAARRTDQLGHRAHGRGAGLAGSPGRGHRSRRADGRPFSRRDVYADSMSSPVQPGSSPSPARRAAPWIIGGLCGLLAVLLVIVLAIGAIWYFALRSTPQGTVEQYLEAWDAQDCETYEKVTTERFRGGEEYSCEEWTSTLQEEHGYEFEDEIGKTTIDGDRAS